MNRFDYIRPESVADAVAAEVRGCYATTDAFRLYDDTTEALHMFGDAGWTQVIVSNHCPELASLVLNRPWSQFQFPSAPPESRFDQKTKGTYPRRHRQ